MNTRDIRRRIKSVKNTAQITKAMEMVSAAKMRKAQDAALRTRAYSDYALSLLSRIARKNDEDMSTLHPLLRKQESKRILLVAVSSNRGLCGGLNTNVIRKSVEYIKKEQSEGRAVDVITVGRKVHDALAKMQFNVIASFNEFGDSLQFIEVSPLTKMAIDAFSHGDYDRVVMCYPHFVSTIAQRPVIKRIMPLGKDLLLFFSEALNKKFEADTNEIDYLFEPSPAEILQTLLPKLVEMQMYQSLLESNASEHSARMVSMKNATDAAKDIIDDLTLTYNQARQAAITREIAEITGGAAALENA